MNFPKINLLKHSNNSVTHKKKLRFLKDLVTKDRGDGWDSDDKADINAKIFDLTFNFKKSSANMSFTREPRSRTKGLLKITTTPKQKKIRNNFYKKKNAKARSLSHGRRFKNVLTEIIPNSSLVVSFMKQKLDRKKFKKREYSLSSKIKRKQFSPNTTYKYKQSERLSFTHKNIFEKAGCQIPKIDVLSSKLDDILSRGMKIKRMPESDWKKNNFFLKKKTKKGISMHRRKYRNANTDKKQVIPHHKKKPKFKWSGMESSNYYYKQ